MRHGCIIRPVVRKFNHRIHQCSQKVRFHNKPSTSNHGADTRKAEGASSLRPGDGRIHVAIRQWPPHGSWREARWEP
ncbi:hypothetical protein UAM5_00051 [Ralstonia phage UAM5]|nr:hypothetical protein UAM5_00051 [Ralstonia phage UAM5]